MAAHNPNVSVWHEDGEPGRRAARPEADEVDDQLGRSWRASVREESRKDGAGRKGPGGSNSEGLAKRAEGLETDWAFAR